VEEGRSQWDMQLACGKENMATVRQEARTCGQRSIEVRDEVVQSGR
jgi:hypothetical protein